MRGRWKIPETLDSTPLFPDALARESLAPGYN